MKIRIPMAMFVIMSMVELAHAEKKPKTPGFVFRAFPMVSMAGTNVTFTAEDLSPLTEANYCPGLEVLWPDGTRSMTQPDCPAWDDYQRKIALAAACAEDVIVCADGFECFRRSCRVPPYDLQRRWILHTHQFRKFLPCGEPRIIATLLLPNKKQLQQSVAVYVSGCGE